VCPRGPHIIDRTTVFAYRFDGTEPNAKWNNIYLPFDRCEVITDYIEASGHQYRYNATPEDAEYVTWALAVNAKNWDLTLRGKPVDRNRNRQSLTVGMLVCYLYAYCFVDLFRFLKDEIYCLLICRQLLLGI
jgi:hypothetical protein